jgi:hypothetical protein
MHRRSSPSCGSSSSAMEIVIAHPDEYRIAPVRVR